LTYTSIKHIHAANEEVPINYVIFNFNDFGSAFVTLFVILVQNNWHLVTLIYTTLNGSLLVYLFFISFYVLAVIAILNIVLAFIIDIYVSVEEIIKGKKEVAEKGLLTQR